MSHFEVSLADRPVILLADGAPATIPDIKSALPDLNCDTVGASDATFVQTLALRHRPAAIVLGARLPAGGPLVALRRLRGSVHTAAIPVVAIVAPGAPKQALLTAGADECLEPPVPADEMMRAIQARLGVVRDVATAPADVLADAARIMAVDRSGLANNEPDESLDLITRLATRVLEAPVTLVSIVGADRQVFKSQIGIAAPYDKGTDLSHSFCQWVVASQEELVVDDARTHAVLRRNLAVKAMGVVAYAGVPIAAATGETIGSFCAIHREPHAWREDERATLRDLAQIVQGQAVLNVAARAEAQVTRVAAQSALGVSRLLRRNSPALSVADRDELVSVLERQAQRLLELTEA
jgi:GAF domain-containing protein